MAGGHVAVRCVDFGRFVRPASESASGADRMEPILGYLVEHARGMLLVDTGMGTHPDIEERYRPHRVSLSAALAALGRDHDDVSAVVNCHLHFDHCGNNPALAGRPIFVQRVELAAARAGNYTLPELVEAPGLVYEEVTGEAEIWDGVLIVPTPGHTDGHQSVVVTGRDGDVVVIAGQTHESATAYRAAVRSLAAAAAGRPVTHPVPPSWVQRLRDLDPRIVYFAHDRAVWTP